MYGGPFRAVQGPKLQIVEQGRSEMKASKSFDTFKARMSNFLALIRNNPPVAG